MDDDFCPICLEDAMLYRFECKHGLCCECYPIYTDTEKDTTKKCPMCRREITFTHAPSEQTKYLTMFARMDIKHVSSIVKNQKECRQFLKRNVVYLIFENYHTYNQEQKEIINTYIRPHLSYMQNVSLDMSIAVSDHQYKWVPCSNKYYKITLELADKNTLIHDMFVEAIEKSKTLNTIQDFRHVTYSGFHPFKSMVTLEDNTSLNLVQYAIYCSDDWETFVKNFISCDITHQLKTLQIGTRLKYNDTYILWLKPVEKITSTPDLLFEGTLYQIVKQRRQIKVNAAKTEWMNRLKHNMLFSPHVWPTTIKKYITYYAPYARIENDTLFYDY
jgi:hypothetical protein